MSADNYMHILKRDGKYVVTNRSASCFYSDEGWSAENPPTSWEGQREIPHPDWVIPPETFGPVFDTLNEAEDYAFSEYSEYGVSYGFAVKRYTVEVDE